MSGCELEMVVWVTGVRVDNDTKWLLGEDNKVNADNYHIYKSLEDISDVGVLNVNVIEAAGLGSSKLQGNV